MLHNFRTHLTAALLALMVLYGGVLSAQQPNYVGPSPQAATFLKYRDYPVDLSTGLVDITVPLLSLDLKSYQLPISAKFHASGRKIDMSYSELGMNWKLDAFGMITREVRGASDWQMGSWQGSDMDHTGDYYNTLPSDDNEGLRDTKFLRRSALDGSNGEQVTDTEHDIFTVSFQGISSTFVMRNQEAVFLDYFPYKVRFYSGVFTLTDEKGVQYSFGNIIENGVAYGSTISYNNSQISGPMSWYLAKLVTPSQDFLRFRYENVNSDGFHLGGNMSYGSTATLGDYGHVIGTDPGRNFATNHNGVLQFQLNNAYYNESQSIAYLTTIESPVGNISLSYNAPYYSLDEIRLLSTGNSLLKKIKFSYQDVSSLSFPVPNNQNRTIKDIQFVDVATQQTHRYAMDYYQGFVQAQDIAQYNYGRDYWGYANSNVHYNMIPIDQVVEMTGNDATHHNTYNRTVGDPGRRNPDFLVKRIGMLSKLTYPTGGHSEFFYEPNLYRVPGTSASAEGPGLRISQVRHSDAGGATINKHYSYGDGGDGVGWLLRKPAPYDFQSSRFITFIPELWGTAVWYANNNPMYYIAGGYRYRYREFYSDPVPSIRPAYNIPVYYSDVTEYQRDEQGNNLGKTTYHFSVPDFNVERKEFYDSRTEDNYHFSKFVPQYYSKAHLNASSIYSFTDNAYVLKKMSDYRYSTRRIIEMPQVAFYRRHNVLSERMGGSVNYEEHFVETKTPYYANADGQLHYSFPWNTIAIRDYKLKSAGEVLDSLVETEYTQDGQISKSTSYQYESLHTNKASSIRETDSKGGYALTKFSYPDDIATAQSLYGGNLSSEEFQAVQQMKKGNGNFASVPVQTESYSSSGMLRDLVRSNFKLVSTIPFLYKVSEKKNAADTLRKNYEVVSFDNRGNPLEVKGRENERKSYVWGYHGQFPVAIIDNASYSEVLNAIGQPVISSLDQVGVSQASVHAAMNTLRSHPNMNNAHVTSFSYEPLVGMTSQTDAKGMSTYYEYDTFGRLENVKDQNGDIVKNYKYNYADGTVLPARAVTYYNSVLNQVFTKSCPSGGVAVTYTVEVGKYTSTQSQAAADALAQADASANGQAYANANGSCSTPQPGGSYPNEAFTITRTKNNCSTGQGSSVSYPVPAGTYTSSISQADARAQAEAMVAAAAQANANSLGTCSTPEPSGSYPNETFIVMRSKNNCPSGQNGIPIEFTVPANTYTSTISQADARMHAEAMLATQAQVYANANGSCAVTSGTFTLNFSAPNTSGFELKIRDMAGNLLSNPKFTGNYVLTNIPGGVGSITIDTWPAGSTPLTYSYNLNGSVQTTGPAMFNNLSLTGTINLAVTQTKFFSFGKSVSLRKNNCAVGLEGSIVTYTVAANTYTSAVSQAAANQLATNDANANAQAYANANGSCSVPPNPLGYTLPYGKQFLIEITDAGNVVTSHTIQGTASIDVPTGYAKVKITSLDPNNKFRFLIAGQVRIGSSVEFSSVNLSEQFLYLQAYYIFLNTSLTVNKTKSDCPYGQVGTVVPYTVAAGAFTSPTSQAAANQLAQDDADANAQNYADANGSCTTPSYSISYAAPAGQQFTVSTSGFPPSSWTISGTGSITSIPSTGNSIHIVPVAPGQYTFTLGGQSMTGSSAYFYNVQYGSTPLQLSIVPLVTYSNAALTVTRTKNDCDPGYIGSTVSYTVAAGAYTSTVSQAAADQIAQSEVDYNAQAYANENGSCSWPPTYYNAQVSLSKTRNNCPAGNIGGSYSYSVYQGKYSSTISQADADQQAQADLTANAQTYANTFGSCTLPTTYYNAEVSLSKTRNNCPSGQTGSSVDYVVAYAKHSSTISQADANQKAQADLTDNAQAYANANGSCNAPTTYYNAQVSLSKTRNNCPAGQTGTSVNYVVAYAKHSSTISQADANQKAQADLTANAQAYANANGSCNLPITYYNAQVFLSKTRNNCPLGQTGSSVNYVVAYAKHSSTISQADADQKAQTDLNANAQAYANAHASCATPVTFMLNYVLPGTKAFIVEVSDPVTGETNAYGISGTGSLGNLTGGLKNIFIYPEIADQATYYFTLLDGGITASGNNANITGQYFSGIVPLKIVE